MQMDAMESATYQYAGPIQTVLDIVAPIAKKSGFSSKSMPAAEAPTFTWWECHSQPNQRMENGSGRASDVITEGPSPRPQ